ncbi:hypothetical protein [Alkalibaculum bacchi]|uniref:hypothetical protein n=1 Tax=Alkalibaculum bacchi TaxID=645887 RepID=UPI0026EE22EE|nr:hypothetical protein [Alkalibaculum bacchi]
MGIQDYSKFIDGKESSKTKKAKKLIEDGQDSHIISEDEFYEIIYDIDMDRINIQTITNGRNVVI